MPSVPLLRRVSKPAVQSKQASASACGAYVPEGHDSQDSSLYTNVPAGQSAWREAGAEGGAGNVLSGGDDVGGGSIRDEWKKMDEQTHHHMMTGRRLKTCPPLHEKQRKTLW